MIKIAAVEDNVVEQKRLQECLNYTSIVKSIEFVTEYFCDSNSLLSAYQKGKYDMLLLDIELPDMNGIELAHKIREVDTDVVIIFVTNMVNFAIRGYEVDAKDYVVKPINEPSFCLRIGRAVASLIKNAPNVLELSSPETGKRFVKASDIKYIDVDGHYVTFHTVAGDFREYSTMKEIENRVNSPTFVKCNRCFLVNLAYVDGIEDDMCVIGNAKLIISRGEKKAFVSKLAKYVSGGLR